ncbi:MAG: hypothetical protein KY448_11000 [Cyanobacteria bacterium 0813]|nr:hypothetical protein [Cyanobacteria bacterium 0813]
MPEVINNGRKKEKTEQEPFWRLLEYEARLTVLEGETEFDERKDFVAVLEPGKKTQFVRSRAGNIISSNLTAMDAQREMQVLIKF